MIEYASAKDNHPLPSKSPRDRNNDEEFKRSTGSAARDSATHRRADPYDLMSVTLTFCHFVMMLRSAVYLAFTKLCSIFCPPVFGRHILISLFTNII